MIKILRKDKFKANKDKSHKNSFSFADLLREKRINTVFRLANKLSAIVLKMHLRPTKIHNL